MQTHKNAERITDEGQAIRAKIGEDQRGITDKFTDEGKRSEQRRLAIPKFPKGIADSRFTFDRFLCGNFRDAARGESARTNSDKRKKRFFGSVPIWRKRFCHRPHPLFAETDPQRQQRERERQARAQIASRDPFGYGGFAYSGKVATNDTRKGSNPNSERFGGKALGGKALLRLYD